MSIRWKFFLVLLAFSLIPLILIAAISQRGTAKLGRTLSDRARVNLTEIVTQDLLHTAENSVAILNQEKLTLEFALRFLAREAERLLTAPPIPPQKVYFAEDYDHPAFAPDDLAPSPKYWKRTENGRLVPAPVSFAHPVFVLAPGTAIPKRSPDIIRLSALRPVFEGTYRALDHTIYRIYVSLPNGLHSAYPGHGSYPQGYDPRRRPWYIAAKTSNKLIWESLIDASTGQPIFTVAMPLHRPEGSFAGVAAIDFLITEALKLNRLHSHWSPRMNALLVAPYPNPDTGETALMILGQKSEQEAPPSWRGLPSNEWLTSSDARRLRTLIERIKAGESGYMHLPYKGVDSIWAYALHRSPVGKTYSFIIIAPEAVVTAMPSEAGAKVLALTREFYVITGITTVAVILIASLVAFLGARTLTRPMMTMISAWQKLAAGDFSARLDLHSGDERDMVYKAFNQTVPELEAHFHMRKSLELAREVQQNLLPRTPPKISGFGIAGASHYCDETGGDYYDIYRVGREVENRFAVIVGDVSGHGVAAALLMATARALLRAASIIEVDLAERITLVNRFLTSDASDTGSFMTLFCLELDITARRMRWVRAGHDPATVYDPADREFDKLNGAGMALGIDDGVLFKDYAMPFGRAGQIIIIGTDGIWEALNANNEMFGKERFFDVIRQNSRKGAREIQEAVFRAVAAFRQEIKQEDDITLVVIKKL